MHVFEFAEDDVDGIDFFLGVKLGDQIGDFASGLEVHAGENVDIFGGEGEAGAAEGVAAFFAYGMVVIFLPGVAAEKFVSLAQDVAVESAGQAAFAGKDDGAEYCSSGRLASRGCSGDSMRAMVERSTRASSARMDARPERLPARDANGPRRRTSSRG